MSLGKGFRVGFRGMGGGCFSWRKMRAKGKGGGEGEGWGGDGKSRLTLFSLLFLFCTKQWRTQKARVSIPRNPCKGGKISQTSQEVPQAQEEGNPQNARIGELGLFLLNFRL